MRLTYNDPVKFDLVRYFKFLLKAVSQSGQYHLGQVEFRRADSINSVSHLGVGHVGLLIVVVLLLVEIIHRNFIIAVLAQIKLTKIKRFHSPIKSPATITKPEFLRVINAKKHNGDFCGGIPGEVGISELPRGIKTILFFTSKNARCGITHELDPSLSIQRRKKDFLILRMEFKIVFLCQVK